MFLWIIVDKGFWRTFPSCISWLPDGYSRICIIVCVWPFGLLNYGSATLGCKMWSLPFLGLRPYPLHPGAIPGKEGIKFCHLATLSFYCKNSGSLTTGLNRVLLCVPVPWGPRRRSASSSPPARSETSGSPSDGAAAPWGGDSIGKFQLEDWLEKSV